jgi:acyl-CoA reductase-like NAD-dependent aldehyde dehydrogenase
VRIAQAAASRLLRLQLELGGKDPVYVCDDAPVDSVAAAVADGAFYNTGQSCCAVERIYVHRAVAAPFIEAFVAQVRGFVVGDPLDERTYIGPLARAAQLEVLDAQVADARGRGARLLTGGARLAAPGQYFAPTVLSEVDHRMTVMREESFGPLIGIQVVADDAEAAARMRETTYGLTAAVYTPQRGRAERLLAGLAVGSAYWNCCDRVSPRLPWSGRRHSGLGLTLSTHGIRAFVQPKAWHLRG